MSRYLMISSDCHAGATPAVYREYLEPAFREAYDETLERSEQVGDRIAETVGLRPELTASEEVPAAELPACWSADRRLAELEKDGIVGEVIFPQPGGPAGVPFYSFGHPFDPARPELADAGARAYNRWLADFCIGSPHPDRHAGIALIVGVDDIDAVLKEIEWAKRAGLRGGVMLRSQPIGEPGWNHPRYEPIWALCEALQMPIHTHGGETPEYGDLPGSKSIFFTEVTWYAHRMFWFLLWSGVLERHPGLELILTEQFTDWIPDQLFRLDAQYAGNVSQATVMEGLSMSPSEYWMRQCYVGSSLMTRRECERRHEIGISRIMWGSDFPHAEGTWPNTEKHLHETFDGLPEAELRPMLGETCAQIYGFDPLGLADDVARVGPEVGTFA